ncbi:hypothetical protein AC1031_001551 [Aphanomyces cochlioides]|nr:hypothetical protein AC1031_001551 [Aphanomyces cochlioides]
MVHLNLPTTSYQDSFRGHSDEQRALSLKTVPPCVNSVPPLKLSTLRSAVLPCDDMNEVKVFEYSAQEKMAMLHETAAECEQLMPPASMLECQDTFIQESKLATASNLTKFPSGSETKSMTDNNWCDSMTSETTSTSDVSSNTSDDDLAVRTCSPGHAMPTSAKSIDCQKTRHD